MANYLLLRNNKQSGPLSQEQLLQLGLKPYDLVWVEGKSAAWRYSSELPELKDYAPVVEEQPYDRFYKKQTEEPKKQEPAFARVANVYEKQKEVRETKEVKEENYEQYIPVMAVSAIKQAEEPKKQKPVVSDINSTYRIPKEQEHVVTQTANVYDKQKEVNPVKEAKEIEEEMYGQYMPKKAVSVIMPKQAASVKKSTGSGGEEPVFIRTTAPAQKSATAVAKKIEEAIIDNSLEAETKYSQPLDEIKEMYVQQLQQRKHKTAQKKFILQSLKKAAIFIAIIGSGVLIGFVIKPKHSSKNNAANPVLQNNSSKTVDATKPETVQADIKAESAPVTETKQQPVNYKNEVAANKPEANQVIIPENKRSIPEKKNVNEEKDESSVNQQAESTVINTAGGERNKNSRIDKAENETNGKNTVAREDVSKLVSVKSNDYKIGAFGGVHNLELTVTNDSKFVLENVMVELQYLKLSEQPVKIEHVRFQSIAPNGSLTMRIPDTNRGAKLFYKIIKIEPKDLNSGTAGL
jgi:hypothetical protein